MKKFKTLLVVMIILGCSSLNQALAQSSTIKNNNAAYNNSAPIKDVGIHINPPPHNLASIKESVKTELRLFPNPSAGNFNLETNLRGSQKLMIFDLTGNVKLQKNVFIDENGLIKVDLNNAPRGLYLVSLGKTTLKFQKI